MLPKQLIISSLGCLSILLALAPVAHGAHISKLECQTVPSTNSSTYDTTVQCVAEVTRPGSSRWHNAYKQHCPTFCAGLGGVNVPSPDGFACTSGEERPWSAINAPVDYSPTGCWHNCKRPEGPPGARSESFRCYHPTQKRDHDRTDTTVGCFCNTGDTGATTIPVILSSAGGAKATGVAATPSGWSRIDKNTINPSAAVILDLAGEVPLGGTGSIALTVKLEGACGTSATISGALGGTSSGSAPRSVSIPLPACPSQCQDGVDNDGDGAVDLADFSCQNDASKNDESRPLSQCQDGIDNDNDGAVDLADLSCSGNQDNNEGDPQFACQDGLDNDQDGLTDLADPGCKDPSDSDESDESLALSVGVECVYDNQDGTYTAYFGYNNLGRGDVEVSIGNLSGTRNEFSPGNPDRGQGTLFKSGRKKGVVHVVFDGSPLTWSVRAAGGALSQVTASSSSPECARVEPIAECIDGSTAGLKATFGYRNTNEFPVVVPAGALNYFSPAPANRGQPTTLLPGLNRAAFEATFTNTLAWNLDGVSAGVSKSTPICPGGCVDTPIGTIKSELNQTALDLAAVTKKAAKLLAKRAKQRARTGALSKSAASRAGTDAIRASKKADMLAKRANELALGLPEVIKSCPFSPPFCQTVDRGETIEALHGLYAEMLDQLKRVMARRNFKRSGETSRVDPLVLEGKALKESGDAQLNKLPRVATVCS